MKPKVYVCLDDHFDYEKGRKLGYDYELNFLGGRSVHSKNATWHGKDSELKTINDTLRVLYNDDFSNISIEGYDTLDVFEEIQGERKFIIPYGYCLLLNPKRAYQFLEVKTVAQIRIVLVDPYSDNGVVLKEGVAVDVGPTVQDEHSYDVFKAKYVIFDQVC